MTQAMRVHVLSKVLEPEDSCSRARNGNMMVLRGTNLTTDIYNIFSSRRRVQLCFYFHNACYDICVYIIIVL